MDERMKKLESLINDEAFADKVDDFHSCEDVQRYFAENGVELSLDEVEDLLQSAAKGVSSAELGEDELESVAGGVSALTVLGWAWKGIKAVGKGAYNLGKRFAKWEQG